jgi:histidine triad (HIT) family protein
MVVETDSTCAFRDLNPVAPVHVLVVPKRHIDSAQTLTPDDADLLAACFSTLQEVAEREGVAEDGYRVIVNVGRHGGMTVSHLHFHLIGGRPLPWPPE